MKENKKKCEKTKRNERKQIKMRENKKK